MPSPTRTQAAFRAREALLPYLYTGLRQAYDTGLGLVRPMYYDFPEEAAAYWQVNCNDIKLYIFVLDFNFIPPFGKIDGCAATCDVRRSPSL